MKIPKPKHSFRFALSVGTLFCWLLPIVIICVTASMLLNRNYNRNLRRSTVADIVSAMRQVEIRLNYAIEDAKAVSYDGVVYQAYRNHLADPQKSGLSQTVSDYLNQKFGRNINYRAVFIHFLDPNLDVLPFAAAPGLSRSMLQEEFRSQILPIALEEAEKTDVRISFTVIADRMYMIRSLTDGNAVPYAILVVELEKAELLQSLHGLSRNQMLEVTIDGVPILVNTAEELDMEPSRVSDLSHSSSVDGHELVCNGQVIGLNIWTTVPMLRWMVLFVSALVVPLLVVIVLLFHRNINHPIEVLMKASTRMRSGERGYQITSRPPNGEFAMLFRDFNAMSSELKCQFDQLYEEQQALQQAKIKALQSQINPHFLNNTLEVINWEARLAGSDRVCSMIEALSTMLDAAIGRDGRSQVLLSEELKYVDAYLYITKQRLGDRLTITKDIDPEALNCTVPLLMLQPILENAVEYDLSRSGGELAMYIYLEDNALHLEVAHDGVVTPDGWAKIHAGLVDSPASRVSGRSVGIHNVVNRLTLLYGDGFRFDIRETRPGRILAEIVLFSPRANIS